MRNAAAPTCKNIRNPTAQVEHHLQLARTPTCDLQWLRKMHFLQSFLDDFRMIQATPPSSSQPTSKRKGRAAHCWRRASKAAGASGSIWLVATHRFTTIELAGSEPHETHHSKRLKSIRGHIMCGHIHCVYQTQRGWIALATKLPRPPPYALGLVEEMTHQTG